MNQAIKHLILTVVNDSDAFWYEQIIPFLLSLQQTDYQGDIGIVSYGLSLEKQAVLQENGCKVFIAPHYYADLLIDRQWAAAQIAEQYDYDIVALYDADIWFPSPHLTLFEQIEQQDKLYCSYDPIYGEFLVSCVRAYGKQRVQMLMDQLIAQNGYVWQAGVVVGYKQAWLAYRAYIVQLLSNPQDFAIEFGIDATAINLYAIDCDGIRHLPERYNCLPSGGLMISNIADGKRLDHEVMTLHGQAVEGLHVVGTFRMWGRHRYEYANWFKQNFYQRGILYRPKRYTMQSLPTQILVDLMQAHQYQHEVKTLMIKALSSEQNISAVMEHDDLLLTTAGGFELILSNPTAEHIAIDIAIQTVVGHPASHQRKIILGQYERDLYKMDILYGVIIPAGASMKFYSFDLDAERSRLIWRFKQIKLIGE